MSTDFEKYDIKDFDSVIFDLDGTLWDSSLQIAEAWNELLKTRHDIVRKPITQDELYRNMGLPMYDIAANLFPDEKPEVRNLLMDDMGIFENEYLKKVGGYLFPDIKEVVSELASEFPVFIVSNCQSGYIEAFMQAHDFNGVFNDHTCWGDTGMMKGDNLLLISKRNDLKRPVYIGDTSSDSKACSHAGIPFIYASYGFGNTSEYDAKVDSAAQIRELLLG